MSDKEKTLETIIKLVDEMPEEKATQFLSFAEGMAAMKKIMEETEKKDEDDK